MTIEEKLNSIRETKEAIKTSIQNKGVEVVDTDTFASYAEKIDNIETGGGDLSEYYTAEYENGRGITQFQETSWYKCILKLPPLSFNGTSCSAIFYYCPAQTMDLSNFDTSNVTLMNRMFMSSQLTELDLSNFNTSNVTNMESMFSGCNKLIKLDLSSFDTSNVTNISSMFNNCSQLTELDLSNFDTSGVSSMQSMFNNCSKLTSLDLSNFDTINVTSIGYMFSACSRLTSLNLSSFDMSNVTYVANMFSSSSNLQNLQFGYNLGKGYTEQTSNYANYTITLSSCTALTHDSLMSIINGLYDLNLTYDVANGGTLYTQKLVLGANNIAKLSEEELAICTTKGWSVS